MNKSILILGVNGFIGHHLVEALLTQTTTTVYGMDLATHRINDLLKHPRFHFTQGDVTLAKAWINEHIQQCDIVFPLVAIATPATYVENPLSVFELDFESNLSIIRLCVQHKKRLLFPSTSEVYGLCPDPEFDEEKSALVLGPIQKERWIYACSKQLLDRIIYAYRKEGLRFTLFRPFNWIGPGLDDIHKPAGGSRVLTQFIGHLLRQEDLSLVDGGQQRRCFTDIDEAIQALLKIVALDNDAVNGKIFNLGNPQNNASIYELAEHLLNEIKTYSEYKNTRSQLKVIAAEEYYGQGYQDVMHRVPSIARAQAILGWTPKISWKTTASHTLADYLL